MNVAWILFLRIQHKALLESVQKWTFTSGQLKISFTLSRSLAAKRPPIYSKQRIVIFFVGATLTLVVTNWTLTFPRSTVLINTHRACASLLASDNMCSLHSDLDGWYRNIHLENSSEANNYKSWYSFRNRLLKSPSIGSSKVFFCNQTSCCNVLGIIMTGDVKPRGSKIQWPAERIFRFVTTSSISFVLDLRSSLSVSFSVFHNNSRTGTTGSPSGTPS